MNRHFLKDMYNSILDEFDSVGLKSDKLNQICDDSYDINKVMNLFLIYANWRERFIGPGIRKVIYSTELRNKLTKDKRLKKIVERIEYKFKNNHDLTPFLTKMIVNKPYEVLKTKEEYFSLSESRQLEFNRIKKDKDILLNFFGLQHMHLDDSFNKRPNKNINFSGSISIDKNGGKSISRSKELLIVKVLRSDVYFINITNHDLFEHKTLEIMQKDFNDLIYPYEISLLQDIPEYSINDCIEMLNNGISVPYKINKKTYMFNPISVDGMKNELFDCSKRLFKELDDIYYKLNVNYRGNIIKDISNYKKSKVFQSELNIKLIIKDGLLFFYDQISGITIGYRDETLAYSEKVCDKNLYSYNFNT